MVDTHCHILHGIDDGSRSKEMTGQMLDQAATAGIREIIATPHITPEDDERFVNEIVDRYQKTKIMAKLRNIDLYLGAEIYYSAMIQEQLEKWKSLYLGNNELFILLESSFIQKPFNFKELVFNLQVSGIKVVFAHPERYRWLSEDRDMLEYLFNSGVFFQLDAGSINGKYSRRAQKFAWELLDSGYAHLVGSDAHNTTGRSFLELLEAKELITRSRDARTAEILFESNPHNILHGKNEIIVINKRVKEVTLLNRITNFMKPEI